MFNSFPQGMVIALFFINSSFASIYDDPFKNKDHNIYKESYAYAKKGNYDKAIDHAKSSGKTEMVKYFKWLKFTKGKGEAPEMLSFADKNSHWPDINKIQINAEKTISTKESGSILKKYFSYKDPITGRGKWLLANSLDNKHQDRKEKLIRHAWINGDFSKGEEETILRQYKKILTQEEHVNRVSRLLWEKKISPALRAFYLLPPSYKKLFHARIALITKRRGVDHKVNSVPKILQNDNGLLYDRIKWRQRIKNYRGMLELFEQVRKVNDNHELWWKAAHYLIRELIAQEKYKKAYKLAKQNWYEPGSYQYAESQWVAGWLALRFLKQSKPAYKHFYNMATNVNFPISKARGAYWAARAAKTDGKYEIANKWFIIAAQYKNTFYGQNANKVLNNETVGSLKDKPLIEKTDINFFKNSDLVKVIFLLAKQDDLKNLKKFLQAAISNSLTPGKAYLISEVGNKINKKYLSVYAAKYAEQQGIFTNDAGFPTVSSYPSQPEPALINAIIRQESRFFSKSKSSAGARGLMQLMPATAKRTARRLHMRYRISKLYEDDYNVKLGAKYINDLIKRYDGNYILAIAAYNGGPGNVNKWIKRNGTPSTSHSTEEIIDWVELIPFGETRNYVQRVLENLYVYRHLAEK